MSSAFLLMSGNSETPTGQDLGLLAGEMFLPGFPELVTLVSELSCPPDG